MDTPIKTYISQLSELAVEGLASIIPAGPVLVIGLSDWQHDSECHRAGAALGCYSLPSSYSVMNFSVSGAKVMVATPLSMYLSSFSPSLVQVRTCPL
jgi:hypothetical protein